MEIKEILNNNRQTTGDYHATAGMTWRRFGESDLLHSPLVYSAFEFRLALERYVFELYHLMVIDGIIKNVTRTKEELLEVRTFSSIITLIHENSGNKLKLYRAFIFNRAFVKIFVPIKKALSVPDIGKYHKYWSKLSEYCHLQLKPTDTWDSNKWIEKGYALLKTVENYLIKISVEEEYGWVAKSSLVKDLSDLREEFVNDSNLTLKSLEIRMNIMKPILELRTGMHNKIVITDKITDY